MFRLLTLLLLAGGAAWFYPPLVEDAASQCAALESRVSRLMAGELARRSPGTPPDLARAASVGQAAIAFTRSRLAEIPPGRACATAYWELMFDADLAIYPGAGRL